MTSPIDAVGYTPYTATNTSNSTNTSTGSGSIDTSNLFDPQEFLQLLVAQLQYQDPSSPADMSSFMQQTATLTQTQAITSMQSSISALLTTEQAQTATNLVGKMINYVDANGNALSGMVTGATSLTHDPQVQVGGRSVALSSVTGVGAQPTSS